jgi:protein-disulfide isomerase
MANGDNGMSKKSRRDMARETARLQREEARKRKLRNKRLTQGGIIVGALVVLAIVGLVVYNGVGAATTAGPLNMRSDGILLTGNGKTISAVKTPAQKAGAKAVSTDEASYNKTVNIVTYIDYQCPYCQEFEKTNESQLEGWVKQGLVTLEIHPIAILDSSSSGTLYSTRAANAAACVANYDPNAFFAVNTALYADQPKEGGSGLPDSKLISIVKKAGANSSAIPSCITGQKFSGWVGKETAAALKGPLPNSNVKSVTGTPTVIINGTQYSGSLTSKSDFSTAVGDAYEKLTSASQ